MCRAGAPQVVRGGAFAPAARGGLPAAACGLVARSFAGRLPTESAADESCRVSHEAIYQWVYAQPVSTLARELISLRTGRKARKGGRRPPPAPRIREPVYIDDRPAEVEGRQVPGHWEGDLVIGKDGKTAVATLVERTSRFLILVPFDRPGLADRRRRGHRRHRRAACADPPVADLGLRLGDGPPRHITATGLPVYFAHPHSPWERGSNENLNRIVREYFPKAGESAPIPSIWRWWLAISTTDPVRFTTGRSPPSYSPNSSSQMLRLAESALSTVITASVHNSMLALW